MNVLISVIEKLAAGFVVLFLLVVVFAYLRSAALLDQVYEIPLEPIVVSADPESVEQGARLARLQGCIWCHGERLEGRRYFINPLRGIKLIAPNLTNKMEDYSDAEFARLIRHGVRPDGTSIQTAMPSFAYYNLSDEDVADIIAYLRSLPPQQGPEGGLHLWPIGQLRYALGRLPPNVADLIDHSEPRRVVSGSSGPVELGRYLSNSMCTECHSDNGRLRVPITPDLDVAAAYTREDFVRLLETGVPTGGRKIDHHMVDAAKYRYVDLTDDEVDALYRYFTASP